jgi:hypothetical protein
MLLSSLLWDRVEQTTDHRPTVTPIVDAAAAVAVELMTKNPVDSHIQEHIRRMDEHRAWLDAVDEMLEDAQDSSEVPHSLAFDEAVAHEPAENSIDDDWAGDSSDRAKLAAAVDDVAVVLLVHAVVVRVARIWTERRVTIEAKLCCDHVA